MKTSVQIIRNVLTNWGSTLIGTIVGLIMMPFVIHHLGDVKYGIWVLIMNFTGYLGLLDLGVSGSIVKYVAEFKARNDRDGLNEVCSTAFHIYLICGVIAFVIATIIAFHFVPFFKIPLEQLSEAKYVTLIVGLQIGLTLPLGFFSGYMRGIQRYDLIAIIRMTFLLIRSLFIVVFLLMGHGLVSLALIHLASTILSGAVRIAYVYRTNPDLKLKILLINKEKVRLLGHYSLFLFLYYLATRMIFAMDSLIIGYYLSAAAVTFYAIPQRLIDYVRILIMATGVVQPTVSHFNAEGKIDKIQSLLISGTKYSLMIALPVGASYVFVGEEFVTLWIGPRYASMTYPVLVILTFGIIAYISQINSSRVLQGLAMHTVTAYVAICEAITNLILSIILVYKYGMVGVAIGTMIPMVCMNIMVIQWYTCRVVRLSPIVYFKEAYLTPIISVLIFSTILHLLLNLTVIHTWLSFLVVMLIALSLYMSCAWFICLSKSERNGRFQQFRAAINLGS